MSSRECFAYVADPRLYGVEWRSELRFEFVCDEVVVALVSLSKSDIMFDDLVGINLVYIGYRIAWQYNGR